MAKKHSTVLTLDAVQVEEVDTLIGQACAVACLMELDETSDGVPQEAAGLIRSCLARARAITRGEINE